MKYGIIAALIAAAPAHAERFGAGIDLHSLGGWGQQADSYTPGNPSPGRGGTYDGDDGYGSGLFGTFVPEKQRDPLRFSKPQPLRGWGKSIFRSWGR